MTGDEKVQLQNEFRLKKPLVQEMEDAKAITLKNIENKNLGPVRTKCQYENHRKAALAENDCDTFFLFRWRKCIRNYKKFNLMWHF